MKTESEKIILTVPCKKVGPDMNGRIFSKEVLAKAIDEFNERTTVQLGQVGPVPNGYVESTEATHIVNHLEFNEGGDTVMANVTLLPTPKGNIIIEILKSGGDIRFGLDCYGRLLDDHKTVDPKSIRIISVNAYGET